MTRFPERYGLKSQHDRRLPTPYRGLHCNSTMSTPLQVRIARAGKEVGTYDSAEALRLLGLGTLKPTDHYWHPGMREWLLLEDLDVGEESLPPPPKPTSDGPLISGHVFWGPKRWLILAGMIFLLVLGYFISTSNRPPLDYEFFNTKRSGVVFRLTISEGKVFPYDEVLIRVTRVLGSDGRSYGAYYPLSKAELLANRCLFSSPGGVNPYGSDCKPGDRYIIKVPKYATPLEIVCPDNAKGLRTDPYSK